MPGIDCHELRGSFWSLAVLLPGFRVPYQSSDYSLRPPQASVHLRLSPYLAFILICSVTERWKDRYASQLIRFLSYPHSLRPCSRPNAASFFEFIQLTYSELRTSDPHLACSIPTCWNHSPIAARGCLVTYSPILDIRTAWQSRSCALHAISPSMEVGIAGFCDLVPPSLYRALRTSPFFLPPANCLSSSLHPGSRLH
jgi:hypothetical protein